MRVPPEIVDRIIDHAYDDYDILITCSLVARDWVPSTRFHLFSRLTMFSVSGRERLRGIINLSPGLLHYCQEFCFDVVAPFTSLRYRHRGFVIPPPEIFERIDDFTSLHSVHIGPYLHFPEAHIRLLVAISEKITTLTLAGGNFESPLDLWKIIRLFPNLRNIRISDLQYSPSDKWTLATPPGSCYSPPIVFLSLHTHRLGFVIQQLAEAPYPLTYLNSLEIHHTSQPQPRLNSLAAKYQDAITTLRFSAYSPLGSDIPPHIGVYRCLQTLILGRLELYAAYPNNYRSLSNTPIPSFAWVTATMETISSRLNRLVFEIAVTEKHHLTVISWEDIDVFLETREQFKDLKSVEVVFRDTLPTTAIWYELLPPGIDLGEDMLMLMWRTAGRGLMKCSTRELRPKPRDRG